MDGKHPRSAITVHTSTTSHHYTMDDTKIMVREDKWYPKRSEIREAIHKRSPAIIRDHKIPPILLQLLSCYPCFVRFNHSLSIVPDIMGPSNPKNALNGKTLNQVLRVCQDAD